MQKNPQSNSSIATNRRLVLAESYHAAPKFASSERASVYDVPTQISHSAASSISAVEQDDIQSSVQAAILKFAN